MKELKEASVTKLRSSQSKHDMTVHPDVRLKFKVSCCECGGIVMRYSHKRAIPTELAEMLGAMGSTMSADAVVAQAHIHPQWWDFAVGGFDKKAAWHLRKMKRVIRKREQSVIRAERLGEALEA